MSYVTGAVCLFWLLARLDFQRFHRNRCISNRSDGLHRTTFQPSSKYCLHFRFHLITKLPVTQVDSTVLPVFCTTRLHWTPGFVHWNLVESIGHDWLKQHYSVTAADQFVCICTEGRCWPTFNGS